MRDLEYISPSFLSDESQEDILSIRFSTGGLCFCVVRDHVLRLFVKESFPVVDEGDVVDIVSRLFKEDAYAHLQYKRTIIQYEKKDKLLIPDALLTTDTLPIWMLSIQDFRYSDFCIKNPVKSLNSTLVSTCPKKFNEFISSLPGEVLLVNSALPFIESSLSLQGRQDDRYYLFLDLHESFFDTMLLKGNDCISFDTNDFLSSEDLLYLLLTALYYNNVPLTSLRCRLSGASSIKSGIIKQLNRFFPDIVMADCDLWTIFCPENPSLASDYANLINYGQ